MQHLLNPAAVASLDPHTIVPMFITPFLDRAPPSIGFGRHERSGVGLGPQRSHTDDQDGPQVECVPEQVPVPER